MSGESKGFYSSATYLGQHRRISQGILKKTACMGQEERQDIAMLEGIKKVWPVLEDPTLEDLSVSDLIDKTILPFIEGLGYANWLRDVVTDMAIKKGDTRKRSSWNREETE